MVQGCNQCYSAVVAANMNLRTEGESWLISAADGHCHLDLKAGETGQAHLVHLVDNRTH